MWRPSNATWYIRHSNGRESVRQWGTNGDRPLVGDYDGDGKTDFTVWRPSDGTWHILRSSDRTSIVKQWRNATYPEEDRPVVGDYDGDGKSDIAVWGSSGWRILRSRDGELRDPNRGGSGAMPIADHADFDGDGRTDIGYWCTQQDITTCPSGEDREWASYRSSDGVWLDRYWGREGDHPLVRDFDGDGRTDLTVWRPSEQRWHIRRSSDGSDWSPYWGGYLPDLVAV